jgi:hypothetical protein
MAKGSRCPDWIEKPAIDHPPNKLPLAECCWLRAVRKRHSKRNLRRTVVPAIASLIILVTHNCAAKLCARGKGLPGSGALTMCTMPETAAHD